MFLKKIKFNMFSKIFCFSIFIVFVTLLINYTFNAFFLEKFYIYRKKEVMLNVIKTAQRNYKNYSEEDFENYIYDIKEFNGIDIEVKSIKKNSSMGHMMRKNMNFKNPEYNKFITQKLIGNDAKTLYYAKKLKDEKVLIVRTSLSVIESHSHESNFFNLITALIASIVSMFAGIIFSKRITKDISYLKEKAHKIAKLEFPENISINRNDEIGDLSRDLEKMSNDLSSSIGNLKSFVSNASHELRTPIAVISTHATALLELDDLNSEDKKKYHEIILKVSNEMKDLTENLLTLSKLDSTVFKVQSKELSLHEILESALEKYDIIELEKDISVNINISNDKIFGDSRILKLVLNNLIQNALKYSEIGGMVEIFEKDEYLFITNSFKGDIDSDLNRLIQPFSRGKNAEDFKLEGTGLGLSIVHKALKLAKIDYELGLEENIFLVKLNVFKRM
ncbi:MAG: histidine kinase dimerization/phospho-acceptor domain-containing protein [Cetobacterium sp.]